MRLRTEKTVGNQVYEVDYYSAFFQVNKFELKDFILQNQKIVLNFCIGHQNKIYLREINQQKGINCKYRYELIKKQLLKIVKYQTYRTERPNRMFLSKKQAKSCNPTRYNSKRPQQEVSFIMSHRQQQSAYESLRSSQEKVLKLRGNSKNSNIKINPHEKGSSINDDLIKNERKYSNASNAQLKQTKKYLLNSNDSTASIHFRKDADNSIKENSTSILNSSMTFNITGSFSKGNKQNRSTIDHQQIVRKKSSQKGLVLTKKSSNESSYIQGYENSQNQNVKPKSARVERPLAENYVFFNLNNMQTSKPAKQTQNRKKLSIDFDAFCKMTKQQDEKKRQTLENFYSQRNSVSNFYQTGIPQRQTSKEKININANDKYASIKMEKRSGNDPKRSEFSQLYNTLMLRSKKKLNDKVANQTQRGSINVSYLQKPEKTNREPQKSQRINNYMDDSSSLLDSNHKRILSILQKSSGSKFFEQPQKVRTSRNYGNNSTNQPQKQTENNEKQKKTLNQFVKYSPNSFVYDYVVGKGGFGKVWKIHCKRTNGVFALKEMSKALIISKKSVPSVMNEQQLLKDLKNPFLVNMIQSFQTRENLYLLMDYLQGGDLRHHLAVKKCFTEDQTKFIIICILLGLKYLHDNEIIHRDIKPENIVLDSKGYARITDLGVARKWRQNNSADTSGTPGYMAPEVLCRQNHSYQVDYFAVGVITYEMMLRKRPYYGKSRKQIRDEVLAKQVQIKRQQIPDGWSLEGADFINRMIQRKPSNRLGFNGIDQIFNHPWLRNVQFHKIQQKRIQAPYIPQNISKGQSEYLNYTSSEDTQIKELIAQNEIMLRQKDVQNLFEGYEHF